jgi:hypothetical protein
MDKQMKPSEVISAGTVSPHRWLTLAAVILALLVSNPLPAIAGKPTRTVIEPTGVLIPAGFGCSFDVEGQPDEDAWSAITEFEDGRIQIISNAKPTLTNLDTGESIVHHSSYKQTLSYDPIGNDFLIELSGRIFAQFFPGEEGPFGEVGEDGALLSLAGYFQATWDLDTELYTSFSMDGKVTDLCTLLSK